LQVIITAFLVFIVIQVIYLLLFLVAFSRRKSNGNAEPRPVSVIVCAHDEEQNLRELIPLLLQQDHPDFEIICVEDRSNDESFDYLYAIAKQDSRLRMVPVKSKPEHINGKKFALTLGIKAARHEWVLLTDADCRPNGNQWIREMSSQFNDDVQIVLGYSPYQQLGGFLNSFIRFEGLITAVQYVGMALLGRPYMGVGRNLAYRKSLFLDNKGFSGHLGVTGGDDDLFVNQRGTGKNTSLRIGSASITYSKPKTQWDDFYVQKVRHLSVGRHYKSSDKLILGMFIFSWIGSWLLLIPAVVFSRFHYLIIGAFVLRTILLTILAHISSRRMGDLFNAWKVPFLDFIFTIYYLVVGLVSLHTNNIRWKKT